MNAVPKPVESARLDARVDPSATPAFAVCITTMNRTATLAACLDNLASGTPRAACIVVSDDSPDPTVRAANAAVVAQHPGVVWLEGPRRGVCANRNNAVRYCLAHAPQCRYVSFVDDDVQIAHDFFSVARARLDALPLERRQRVMLTGGSSSGAAQPECHPVRLSFAGYFMAADEPQCVNIHAAVFPLALFSTDSWDENIFFGVEDAELSLRALKKGYSIELVPALRAVDTMPGTGVIDNASRGARGISVYRQHCEAARLYVGVKRYRVIDPSLVKYVAFITTYFAHLTLYLAKRRALSSLVPIVRMSNVRRAATLPR
ncbi:glycosyltransferase [Paraburkholderia sp. Tr-20389]|uniref:glycosyltransferase family 2 protein n=1 Tax=Paraburkholderia sp. Tr-20389 TaxID=2703903 RepID=UPI00197CB833|nr:glycosyltransferase [Paraburkholderia sp. Tr-20389]MBN3757130.1 glycosyltransferase [Paraburkholderia sp. Tr-20389]